MIDNAMVQKLAAAAHIDLAPEELDRMAVQLTDILEQISSLTQVSKATDTSADRRADARQAGHADTAVTATEPADVRAVTQPLRPDEPGADKLHGTLSRFAPEVRDGFFIVPLLPSHGGSAS